MDVSRIARISVCKEKYVCEGDTLYLNDPAQEGESLMFTRQALEGNEADTSAAADVQKDR